MEFKGTKEQGTNTEYTRHTGLESFQLLGINPTQQELGEWQNREVTRELNYDIKPDLKGNNVRPVVFYFKGETAGIQQLSLSIGDQPAITNTGNYQIITSTGSIVWAKSAGSPDVKPEFADHRPLVQGEAALITLLQKFLNFDRKSNEDFQAQLQSYGLDAKTLFDGNYKAYKQLVTSFPDNWVTMPMVVIEKDEVNDQGQPVTKLKNYLGTSQYNVDKTVFSGKVSEWIKGQFTKNLVKKNPEDKDLIQGLYTVEFMPFDKTKCLNNVPSNPTVTTGGWN